MEALDASTVADWKYDWNKYTDYLINKSRNLKIAIEKNQCEASIAGVYSKIFTNEQSNHLYNKAILMMAAIEKRKKDNLLQEDIAVLKHHFPKCFN